MTVLHADALDALRSMPDNSVDSIVTDPPYGLAEHKPEVIAKALAAWLGGDREHVPDGRGFMGRRWDAFVPPPAVWDEALRVLKPGGHLLAFAGSRTADLMGISIRLAGFEMRDTITWHYASGFPKSLDVSKAIDKAGGDPLSFRRFARAYAHAVEVRHPLTHSDVDRALGIKSSSCYWAREDHRGGLPPRHHWEKVRDLLALPDELEALYDETEREVIGERTTGRGSGRGDVAFIGDGNRDVTAPATEAAQQWSGWGTALKPASEPVVVARKPLGGTVAACVLTHGTGALNIDGCRVEGAEALVRPQIQRTDNDVLGKGLGVGVQVEPSGRWPANVVLTHAPDCGPDDTTPCVDGCPVADLDAQSGRSVSSPAATPRGRRPRGMGETGERGGDPSPNGPTYADEGGASRFFPTFRYQAKAPTRERPSYVTDDGRKIAHPTVKPLALIRWLVRLVTPPGGLVVDPFAGSGTTGEAAMLEGFRAILVEMEGDHLPLIAERLARVPAQPSPALAAFREMLGA